MGTKLFLGNIPFSFGEGELGSLFKPYGDVIDARIIVDGSSGLPSGFGLVEMSCSLEALAAINACNGRDAHRRGWNPPPQTGRNPLRMLARCTFALIKMALCFSGGFPKDPMPILVAIGESQDIEFGYD